MFLLHITRYYFVIDCGLYCCLVVYFGFGWGGVLLGCWGDVDVIGVGDALRCVCILGYLCLCCFKVCVCL